MTLIPDPPINGETLRINYSCTNPVVTHVMITVDGIIQVTGTSNGGKYPKDGTFVLRKPKYDGMRIGFNGYINSNISQNDSNMILLSGVDNVPPTKPRYVSVKMNKDFREYKR